MKNQLKNLLEAMKRELRKVSEKQHVLIPVPVATQAPGLKQLKQKK